MQSILLYKLITLALIFIINGYLSFLNLPWYYIIPIYGIYLIAFIPSLIHAMYLFSAIQHQIKAYQCYNKLPSIVKCLIMLLTFVLVPILSLLSIAIQKNITFYFVLSSINLLQYFSACYHKKYSFTRVLLYDLSLTFLLTLFGAFLPSLNFIILSWKDLIIFWSYYLLIFIIAIVVTLQVIKRELQEEVHLE